MDEGMSGIDFCYVINCILFIIIWKDIKLINVLDVLCLLKEGLV